MGNAGAGVASLGVARGAGGVSGIGGAAQGGVGVGGVGTAAQAQGVDSYALRGIYFKREWYPNPTDCLNAASSKRLPLDVCR
jgi:hypothetical protein